MQCLFSFHIERFSYIHSIDISHANLIKYNISFTNFIEFHKGRPYDYQCALLSQKQTGSLHMNIERQPIIVFSMRAEIIHVRVYRISHKLVLRMCEINFVSLNGKLASILGSSYIHAQNSSRLNIHVPYAGHLIM